MDNLLDDELNEVMERDPTPEVDDADNVNVETCGVLVDQVNKGIHSLKFNYNDQYIASGHRDGKVRIFNVVTQKWTCTLDCNRGGNETLVQSVKWRPKIEGRTNNILMTACRDTVMEWHTPSRKIVHSHTFKDNMTCYSIEYSNDGLHYACGIADASIQVFDAVTRKEEITLGGFNNKKVAGHQNKIFALKYHRENSKILISGGWDQVLIYWDLTTGTPIKKVTGPQLYGEGLDINCFDEILTASWRKDDPLEVWEYETGNRRMSIEASFKEKDNLRGSTQLYCCKFSKDYGRLIYAGGSQVNCVKIFDCFGTSVASIGEYSHAVLALDSSNDFSKGEQKLAVGGGDGKIRLYKIKYGPNFK